MSTDQLIAIDIYCAQEELDISFVQALGERGLIRITIQEERSYIDPAHLAQLERLARMHYDLEINLEGLEAISHLLERVEHLQDDLRTLRERLRLYEGGGE